MLSVNWIGQVVNGSLRPLITCDRREPKMTVSKLTTLADYIADAERKYDKVAEESGFKSDYALGCLRGLQLAAKASDIRTEVETAVIDAAIDFLLYGGSSLPKAVNALLKERGRGSEATAQRIVADGYHASSCDDCGSDLHPTDSVYCPVRQQG